MRIEITDDNGNYLRWGQLVVSWINDSSKWPQNVGDLRKQMAGAKVDGTVQGPDSRPVTIQQYPDNPQDALMLVLPTADMLQARMGKVTAGPYPREIMPSFMDIAYGAEPRVPLSQPEATDFAIRRVGEYTINECC